MLKNAIVCINIYFITIPLQASELVMEQLKQLRRVANTSLVDNIPPALNWTFGHLLQMTVICHTPYMCSQKTSCYKPTPCECCLYMIWATMKIPLLICGYAYAPIRWILMTIECKPSLLWMEQQTWRQQDVEQASGIGCGVYVTSCT